MERRRAGLSQVMIQQENFTSYSWGYQVSHEWKLILYTNCIVFCKVILNVLKWDFVL